MLREDNHDYNTRQIAHESNTMPQIDPNLNQDISPPLEIIYKEVGNNQLIKY